MTTIAYRDGVLAADTQITADNSIVSGRCTKIGNSGEWFYAVSGRPSDLGIFERWLSAMHDEARERLKPSDEMVAIVVVRGDDGLTTKIFDGENLYDIKAPFIAKGSGYHLAMGAMAMGATAEEAVRIACQYDIYSSEPIETVRL